MAAGRSSLKPLGTLNSFTMAVELSRRNQPECCKKHSLKLLK
jgi:hypothetical protein